MDCVPNDCAENTQRMKNNSPPRLLFVCLPTKASKRTTRSCSLLVVMYIGGYWVDFASEQVVCPLAMGFRRTSRGNELCTAAREQTARASAMGFHGTK